MRYEEWLLMPEVSDATEEVVNGETRITPPAKLEDALIVTAISESLRAQLEKPNVVILMTSFGLVIRRTPLTSRVPDIAVFERESMAEQDAIFTPLRNS